MSVSYTHLDVYKRQVLGVSRRDRLRDDNITNLLGIYNLNETINQYRQNWTDHVETKHKKKMSKQILVLIRQDGRVLED